jgi:hypothetical protein
VTTVPVEQVDDVFLLLGRTGAEWVLRLPMAVST